MEDKNKKIRQEFAETMLEVGKTDPNLVVLVGDISHFALQPFAKACPGRFYNIGICEPTMVNLAAGLSKVGLTPVVHTIAPFLVERSFEQIKLDFGYQKLGVNIVSVGSAYDYARLGVTHHCYDDFALLKNVENSQIIYPGSCKEFNLLFKQTYNNNLPTYFRVPENKHMHEFKDEDIVFGKGIVAKSGKDITIITCGPQLKTALDSVRGLEKIGIDPEIIYLHTIKPYDAQIVNKSLSKTKKALVIEEHSKYGGLFEEVLRESRGINKIKYSSINLEDKFVRTYGTPEELCEYLGFTKENVLKKVARELI
ncbi:MAG: transketolase family protein [Candidatus Nanoarchaeia archaeon]